MRSVRMLLVLLCVTATAGADSGILIPRDKNQPDPAVLSLDDTSGEALYDAETANQLSPDQLFERRWAQTVLDQALRRLGEEYAATGFGDQSRSFTGFFPDGKGFC